MASSEEKPASLLEQHVGTIMQTVVLGMLGWTLVSMVDMQKDVAVVQTQIESLIATVEFGANDRYRGADALRDFAAVARRIDAVERRLDKVEERAHE